MPLRISLFLAIYDVLLHLNPTAPLSLTIHSMSHHEPGELLSHNTDPAIDTDALGELGDLAYEDLEDAFDDFDDDSYEDNSLSELSVVDYLDNQDEYVILPRQYTYSMTTTCVFIH